MYAFFDVLAFQEADLIVQQNQVAQLSSNQFPQFKDYPIVKIYFSLADLPYLFNAADTFNTTMFIDCGATQGYFDDSGNFWAPDQSYVGGYETFTNVSIDPLVDYQRVFTESVYGEGYLFFVMDGVYELTLIFAENEYTSTGDRVFGVFAEGQSLFPNGLDIWSYTNSTGTILQVTTNVTVNDSVLNVNFFRGAAGLPTIAGIGYKAVQVFNTAMLSSQAMELPDAYQVNLNLAVKLINLGYGPFVDNQGNSWEGVTDYLVGGTMSSNIVFQNGLLDTNYLWSNTQGGLTEEGLLFRLPSGTYTFRFIFTELSESVQANERVFWVFVNQENILYGDSIDVVAQVGFGNVYFVDFTQTIPSDAEDGTGEVFVLLRAATMDPILTGLAVLPGNL